jgi:hypothetical protein
MKAKRKMTAAEKACRRAFYLLRKSVRLADKMGEPGAEQRRHQVADAKKLLADHFPKND